MPACRSLGFNQWSLKDSGKSTEHTSISAIINIKISITIRILSQIKLMIFLGVTASTSLHGYKSIRIFYCTRGNSSKFMLDTMIRVKFL